MLSAEPAPGALEGWASPWRHWLETRCLSTHLPQGTGLASQSQVNIFTEDYLFWGLTLVLGWLKCS